MAVAYIKSVANVTTGAGTSVSKAIIPATTGNLLIVFGIKSTTGATYSISDTATNTWNVLQTDFNDGASGCKAWWANANGNTSTTITVSATTTGGFIAMLVDEFSGHDSTTPINGKATATGSGTPSVTVTPGANDCFMYAATADNVTAVGKIGPLNTASDPNATKGADDLNNDWSENILLSGQSGTAQFCRFTGSTSYLILGAAIQPPVATGTNPAVGIRSFMSGGHR